MRNDHITYDESFSDPYSAAGAPTHFHVTCVGDTCRIYDKHAKALTRWNERSIRYRQRARVRLYLNRAKEGLTKSERA